MQDRITATLSAVAHTGWGRLALFILLFITLSVAAPYAIYSELGGRSFRFDPRLLSWPVLSTSVLLLAIYFSSDGMRLYHTLKALGQRLPKRHLVRLVFINFLFSNITPMATGGGFAQIWYLRRYGIHLGTATAATTVRTLLAVALIFTPTPFLLALLPALRQSPLIGNAWAYLGLFACAYLGFFAVVVFRIRWILTLIDVLIGALHRYRLIGHQRLRRWKYRVRREILRFSYGVGDYLKGPKIDILLSVFHTGVFLTALFSFPAILLWGLGYRIDYLTIVGLLVVATFLMYFSPTPGASGIAEGVFGLFFSSMVGVGDLVLVIVAWRLLTIYAGMLIGVPVTLYEIARKEPAADET
ncbi:MAG: lysylphosphatidylglycerol synthase transmembrane domain-containing protein [Desulfuromonadales bacterium]